jgi:hypothetical protein
MPRSDGNAAMTVRCSFAVICIVFISTRISICALCQARRGIFFRSFSADGVSPAAQAVAAVKLQER